MSMNRPVALLSNNAFTAIPSWLSNFSNPTFNQTSLNGRSVCCMSLTLSVVLVDINLLPGFSRHNTLYILLEASQELTVLHFLLLTPTAFLVTKEQWMLLVVTLGGCSERTRWSSHWIAALLILLLQWLYSRVPWSHVLSRMFYGHLTLSCDLAY